MLITGNVDTALWAAMRDGSGGCECFDGCCYKVSARVESLPEHSAICKFAISPRTRPRAVPREKGGTADNTSRNEIRPLFARVKLAPPLHKHYLYAIKSIQ